MGHGLCSVIQRINPIDQWRHFNLFFGQGLKGWKEKAATGTNDCNLIDYKMIELKFVWLGQRDLKDQRASWPDCLQRHLET